MNDVGGNVHFKVQSNPFTGDTEENHGAHFTYPASGPENRNR